MRIAWELIAGLLLAFALLMSVSVSMCQESFRRWINSDRTTAAALFFMSCVLAFGAALIFAAVYAFAFCWHVPA